MGAVDVSVVLPTFDRPLMTLEAARSVLDQRDASLELIIVDDGSTDETIGVTTALAAAANDEAGSKRVHILRATNRGPAAARNAGIAMSSAPLVAFIDSDDLWVSGKLAAQLEFMHRNPECAISQTEEIWLRDGRRVNPGNRHRMREGDIFVDSLYTCLISPSAAIVRRRLFDEVGGFDEDLRAAEDYDLWLRILAHHHAGLVRKPLTVRRAGHIGQLSASIPAIDRFRILALLKLMAGKLPPDRRDAVADAIVLKCGVYGKGLLRRGRKACAAFIDRIAQQADGEWRTGPCESIASATAEMRMMIRSQMRFDGPVAE